MELTSNYRGAGSLSSSNETGPTEASVRYVRWSEEEFESVFLAHYPHVRNVVMRILGNPARAEELATETFWKLYRQPPSSRDGSLIAAWLHRTATRKAIDTLRSASRRTRYERSAAEDASRGEPAADPMQEVLRSEVRECVRVTLGQLKPAQAQVLILRSSDFSYKELASALGVKTGSVGTLLARAEAAFEKQYRLLYKGDQP